MPATYLLKYMNDFCSCVKGAEMNLKTHKRIQSIRKKRVCTFPSTLLSSCDTLEHFASSDFFKILQVKQMERENDCLKTLPSFFSISGSYQ